MASHHPKALVEKRSVRLPYLSERSSSVHLRCSVLKLRDSLKAKSRFRYAPAWEGGTVYTLNDLTPFYIPENRSRNRSGR